MAILISRLSRIATQLAPRILCRITSSLEANQLSLHSLQLQKVSVLDVLHCKMEIVRPRLLVMGKNILTSFFQSMKHTFKLES